MKTLHMLPHYIAQAVGDHAAFKWLTAAVVTALNYVVPGITAQTMAIALFAFIVLDTMTGARAAYVTGEKITSAKLGRVGTKLLGYGSVCIVSSLVTKLIPDTNDIMQELGVSATLGLFMAVEGLSILENVKRMGVIVPKALLTMLEGRVRDDGAEQTKP